MIKANSRSPAKRTAARAPASGSRAAGKKAPARGLPPIAASLPPDRQVEEIYTSLIDAVSEVSGAQRILIILEHENGLSMAGVRLPTGEDQRKLVAAITPWIDEARRTRKARLRHGPQGAKSTDQRSCLIAPLVSGVELTGYVYADIDGAWGRFDANDLNLLAMLASQTALVLANARRASALEAELAARTAELVASKVEIDERASELAVINAIQQALAAELGLQEIYDAVGDKLREIFDGADVGVRIYDEKSGMVSYPYTYEMRERLFLPPNVLSERGFMRHIVDTGRTLLVNEHIDQVTEQMGSYLMPGTVEEKSALYVPLISDGRVRGLLRLTDTEREHAYTASHVRLLETLASSMSVALSNARLFDQTQRLLKETEQRAAELAVINSIQQGMAQELNFQAIIDLVGGKLREVLHTEEIGIRWYDPNTGLIHYLYEFEHGERLHIEPKLVGGTFKRLLQTRRAFVLNSREEQAREGIGHLAGTDHAFSVAAVPIIGSDRVLGSIHLEDYERENAYGESEIRLLTTVAASMGVALENARLLDETQRLYKETDQRAAELAIINSVQDGLASKLDFTAIIDLVGDKVAEIFKTEDMSITLYDKASNTRRVPYFLESGKRFVIEPKELGRGFAAHVIRTGQTLLIGEDLAKRAVELGAEFIGDPQGVWTESYLAVPILRDEEAVGLISLYAYPQHAFSDSDVRLLQTLAGSMSVALENARLFDETQRLLSVTEQRAGELAVINSIQQGIAAELEFLAIIDLVGDELRAVLSSEDIQIIWFDASENKLEYLYVYEHGKRIHVEARTPVKGGPFEQALATRSPIVRVTTQGMATVQGTDLALCDLTVPIIAGDQVLGAIGLDSFVSAEAFGEAEIRLVSTVASSMGVALENARLFDETQRLLKETEERAAELAIINSVQQALAAELSMQGIYDAVGDKIGEIFGNSDVSIAIYDDKAKLRHFPYLYESGQRLHVDAAPFDLTTSSGIMAHVMRSRQTLVISDKMLETAASYGAVLVPGTQMEKSSINVPLISGNQARGVIGLVNMEREHAFTPAQVRLLETLAAGMSVALENARLFDETQRLLQETGERAAELAIINSVQQALAAELSMQGIYDAVGDKIREIFQNGDVTIRIHDAKSNTLLIPYIYESGQRLSVEPSPFNPDTESGFTAEVMRTRTTMLVNERMNEKRDELGTYTIPGTAEEKSAIIAPLVSGNQARGVIALLDMEREHAFTAAHVRLLETLAASMSVALENARLFDETQRLLKETEERAAELASSCRKAPDRNSSTSWSTPFWRRRRR